MNAKHAIGVAITAASLFSSAAFAQSASSGFETSWLHLRDSHGVGVKVGEAFAASAGARAIC